MPSSSEDNLEMRVISTSVNLNVAQDPADLFKKDLEEFTQYNSEEG